MTAHALLPVPTEDSAPYWDACARHELAIQRCESCARFQFYPRVMCVHCSSRTLTWERVSGLGTVYSFTIVHRPPSRELMERVPYVVALVDLDEGVRMMTHVVGCDPSEIEVGKRVEVAFEDRAPGISLPVFVLARAA